jgi:NhaP-type Na+/H+ or K+/H+ antiporter
LWGAATTPHDPVVVSPILASRCELSSSRATATGHTCTSVRTC